MTGRPTAAGYQLPPRADWCPHCGHIHHYRDRCATPIPAGTGIVPDTCQCRSTARVEGPPF